MTKQRKLRVCSAILLIGLIFTGALSIVPARVSADYDYSCIMATAQAAEVSIRKVHAGGTYGAMEVAEFADGDIYDIYAPADDYYYTFKTSNFTDGFTGFMPPEDANITGVVIEAFGPMVFPPTTFSYALEGEDAYNTSSVLEDYQYNIGWDVSYLENWTWDIFVGNDFWVKAQLQPDGLTHYYLDYVGLSIWYTMEDEYEGGTEEDPISYDGSEVDYGLIYGDGLIGTLGFIGLIGMIAVPGLAVYIYRNGNEGNVNLFVKMLALFMFCLTMFMYSINTV